VGNQGLRPDRSSNKHYEEGETYQKIDWGFHKDPSIGNLRPHDLQLWGELSEKNYFTQGIPKGGFMRVKVGRQIKRVQEKTGPREAQEKRARAGSWVGRREVHYFSIERGKEVN